MPERPTDLAARLIEDRLGERARVREAERAILVDLQAGDPTDQDTLRELHALCRTAGVEVLGTLVQRRRRPHAATFLGKGKADQLKELVATSGAQVVIFNDELTPAQGRNLEELLGVKIIDRAQLIMDIFAQRATTAEAKLQVELAQLEYLLPRLRGWGEALSRLGGGIGTRGPGETKLTLERRQLRRRLQRIQALLEEARVRREVKRQRRRRGEVPQVVLVGYTNAGKSTLLNRLTGAAAPAEDRLFATLDPLARRAELPDGRQIVLLDTVGFIRKLPRQLVPAFQSTLEAVREADLMLHVLDASSPRLLAHWQTVQRILQDVLADAWPPVLHALNKVDRVTTARQRGALEEAQARLGQAVPISALTGAGVAELLGQMEALLEPPQAVIHWEIPYAKGAWLDRLHRLGEVVEERYESEGIALTVRLDRKTLAGLTAQAAAEGIRWRAS